MQIESGKYYKTSDGRVVGPMTKCGHGDWPWSDDDQLTYRNDGTWSSTRGTESHNDLIAIAYPETGTLQEIGAKVGDVVGFFTGGRNLPDDNGDGSDTGIVNKSLSVYIAGRGTFTYEYDATFRMITRASEAKPSPVREVTRKEIVPGFYGAVAVSDNNRVGIRVSFPASRLSRADLTAAIATLTEIRDAMVLE